MMDSKLQNTIETGSNIYSNNSFSNYLMEWDENYKSKIKNINIFNTSLTSQWSSEQKIRFARIFYHARGHFHNFLWFLGNFSSSKMIKDIVLKNIAEEFNGAAQSHEQMYINFAQSLNADIKDEITEQTSYLPFLKDFNNGHVKWLQQHDEVSQFAAFSAYEHLDNVDYTSLWELAKSLGTSNKGLIFFKVHMHANHFKSTEDNLMLIWQAEPDKVKEAYEFIAEHQIEMWRNISDAVFSYH